jgi:hypothetical protein
VVRERPIVAVQVFVVFADTVSQQWLSFRWVCLHRMWSRCDPTIVPDLTILGWNVNATWPTPI